VSTVQSDYQSQGRKTCNQFHSPDSFSAVILIYRSVHSHLACGLSPPPRHPLWLTELHRHRAPAVHPSRRSVSRRRGFCAAPVTYSPSAEHPATSRHEAERHRPPSGSSALRLVKRKLRCDDSEGHGNQRRQRPRGPIMGAVEQGLWERQRGGRRRPG
jgi:hypothetical protein